MSAEILENFEVEKFAIGDECWIIVGDDDHPKGCWLGEIIKIENGIEAKIIDENLRDDTSAIPTNYFIIPKNEITETLVTSFKSQIKSIIYKSKLRESSFVDIFKGLIGKNLNMGEIRDVANSISRRTRPRKNYSSRNSNYENDSRYNNFTKLDNKNNL